MMPHFLMLHYLALVLLQRGRIIRRCDYVVGNTHLLRLHHLPS